MPASTQAKFRIPRGASRHQASVSKDGRGLWKNYDAGSDVELVGCEHSRTTDVIILRMSDLMDGLVPEQMHLLVYVGLLLLASQVGGRFANAMNAPRVTGYLVVGILLGPSVFGLLSRELIERDMAVVTDIALAIIAFSVGGSLALSKLRRLGNSIFVVAISQALGASLVVTTAMWGVLSMVAPESAPWTTCLALALVVGTVSAATAPAAIISIVREYRARGPFTTMLLGVVAIDDGLTIVLFAVAMNVAAVLGTGNASNAAPLYEMLLTPFLHVLVAIGAGCRGGMDHTRDASHLPGTRQSFGQHPRGRVVDGWPRPVAE